jgi:hypothetical protein
VMVDRLARASGMTPESQRSEALTASKDFGMAPAEIFNALFPVSVEATDFSRRSDALVAASKWGVSSVGQWDGLKESVRATARGAIGVRDLNALRLLTTDLEPRSWVADVLPDSVEGYTNSGTHLAFVADACSLAKELDGTHAKSREQAIKMLTESITQQLISSNPPGLSEIERAVKIIEDDRVFGDLNSMPQVKTWIFESRVRFVELSMDTAEKAEHLEQQINAMLSARYAADKQAEYPPTVAVPVINFLASNEYFADAYDWLSKMGLNVGGTESEGTPLAGVASWKEWVSKISALREKSTRCPFSAFRTPKGGGVPQTASWYFVFTKVEDKRFTSGTRDGPPTTITGEIKIWERTIGSFTGRITTAGVELTVKKQPNIPQMTFALTPSTAGTSNRFSKPWSWDEFWGGATGESDGEDSVDVALLFPQPSSLPTAARVTPEDQQPWFNYEDRAGPGRQSGGVVRGLFTFDPAPFVGGQQFAIGNLSDQGELELKGYVVQLSVTDPGDDVALCVYFDNNKGDAKKLATRAELAAGKEISIRIPKGTRSISIPLTNSSMTEFINTGDRVMFANMRLYAR